MVNFSFYSSFKSMRIIVVSIFLLILVLVTGRAQMSQPSHHHRLIPHLDDHSSDCCDKRCFLQCQKRGRISVTEWCLVDCLAHCLYHRHSPFCPPVWLCCCCVEAKQGSNMCFFLNLKFLWTQRKLQRRSTMDLTTIQIKFNTYM